MSDLGDFTDFDGGDDDSDAAFADPKHLRAAPLGRECALGICGYLGYLAFHVFQDSWLFPIALSAIGLGIIYVGIQGQKHEQAITHKLRALLPVVIREWLSSRP